jgi:hypothetical protein
MSDGWDECRLILLSQIARTALEVTSRACGVHVDALASKQRSRAEVCLARQIAIYLGHVVGGLSTTELSLAFGRDRSTVAHAIHIIEDRRDSPIFDRQVQLLEGEMHEVVRAIYERLSLPGAPSDFDLAIARMHVSKGR